MDICLLKGMHGIRMEKALDIYKLIADLKDENVSVRRIAAKNLADADERAVYPLLSALRDDNPGVQDAAMRSLVSIGGQVVAYMVLPLLELSMLSYRWRQHRSGSPIR